MDLSLFLDSSARKIFSSFLGVSVRLANNKLIYARRRSNYSSPQKKYENTVKNSGKDLEKKPWGRQKRP